MSRPSELFHTHDVENQPPPLADFNAWALDLPLQEGVAREGAAWAAPRLDAYGRLVGGELQALGFDANRHRPELRLFDRHGHRLDEVEFHPAYHQLLQTAIAHGVHALSWQLRESGGHVARAALSYLHHQAEAGTSCPLTMTHAAVPVLARDQQLAAEWLPKVVSSEYSPRLAPPLQKRGLTLGMGMTEKQGGSDVRSNSTRAHDVGRGEFELVGHKWFFSAPMSDAFLVLAQEAEGIGCFLLPRIRPDGGRNAMRIQRLKDKLGNWSNASSEVEFHGAWAQRVGEPGRGVPTIIEMVALTRLDCMLGSAAEIRRATVEALHHAQHRRAFGKALAEQPLMQNVLADLALESEAATALAMRIARAVDASPHDAGEAALARICTAIGKYWICRRAPAVVNEAQECLGGAGYVEESILPRLYREAPLNSIWEGSGNVQCLDVLRALAREAATQEALWAELGACRGAHPLFDAALARLQSELAGDPQMQARARWLVERCALLLQGALLLRHAPPAVSSAFVGSRLGDSHGLALGTLSADVDFRQLMQRAWPPLA